MQLRLARLPGGPDHPEWLRLAIRSQQLIRKFGEAWTPSFYRQQSGVEEPQFDRGFVEYVRVEATVLLDAGSRERLLTEAPIRHLDITGISRVKSPIIASRLQAVLKGVMDDGYSWRVLSLGLDGQGLGDEAAQQLADSGLSISNGYLSPTITSTESVSSIWPMPR